MNNNREEIIVELFDGSVKIRVLVTQEEKLLALEAADYINKLYKELQSSGQYTTEKIKNRILFSLALEVIQLKKETENFSLVQELSDLVVHLEEYLKES